MQKYNYELDLTTLNSNSIIINHIKERTEILEFGPAFGRLTKYLKDTMLCEVDIVEIDEESGNVAKEYARNSCIGLKEGNIDEMYWAEKLNGHQYDYIIFADVLEHLKKPEIILNKCKVFLKENGKILCSIPNIAHSSIILSLWNDDFKYSDVGLLDNTHIHFFTKKTFEQMAKNTGFRVCSVEEIVSEVGANEIHYGYNSVPKTVETELHFRREGNVYQYIFELVKANYSTVETIYNYGTSSGYECTCFFKQKNDADYLPTKCIKKRYFSKNVKIYFDFTKIGTVEGVCITLFEDSAVLRINSILMNGNSVEYSTNGYKILENQYYFTNNSQVFISGNTQDIQEIILDFEFLFTGHNTVISSIVNMIVDIQNEALNFKESLIKKENEVEVLLKENEALLSENKSLKDKYADVCNEKIFDMLKES